MHVASKDEHDGNYEALMRYLSEPSDIQEFIDSTAVELDLSFD